MQAAASSFLAQITQKSSRSDVASDAFISSWKQHERVYNFLHVPVQLERFLALGYVVCLDAFLDTFTVLPLCLIYQLFMKRTLNITDLLRAVMIVLVWVVLNLVDASRLYHSVRGQSTLKLYVIFNVLEIADKLCCSFGLDILESFFGRFERESEPRNPEEESKAKHRLPVLLHFPLAVLYLFVHSMVLFYQAVTLNVAVNSFNNALLTLLVSNQFVEIKGAVFKKFERENLFQLSCADVVERFQLSIYILLIAYRNMTEYGPALDWSYFAKSLLTPLMMIWGSELVVDWLKHAFITKFNHIQPTVYSSFGSILRRDLRSPSSVSVPRRVGFSPLPLTCLVLRTVQSFSFTNFLILLVSAVPLKLVTCWIRSPSGQMDPASGKPASSAIIEEEKFLEKLNQQEENIPRSAKPDNPEADHLRSIKRYDLARSRIP